MTETFASKLRSQGSIEQESIEGCEEFSFCGNLIKEPIPVLNQLKNQQFTGA